MEKLFTISQTARIAGMTAETLRHYDRIDLVKPCKIDDWTGYRYYSQQEIVILNTVKALQCMDLSLCEIKEILNYNDMNKIIVLLKQAEKSAENKIAELEYSKTKIQRARAFYESKLQGDKSTDSVFVKTFPKRAILISEKLDEPTLDNLWDYHRHYYEQLGEEGEDFIFEDLAGIYQSEDISRLFAMCTRYKRVDGLKILPKGEFLCADCTSENREQTLNTLIEIAQKQYNVKPAFSIHLIVLSGILQWNYQIQIPLNKN